MTIRKVLKYQCHPEIANFSNEIRCIEDGI